jgi:YebC/PmpR family DNA-binding regulatory protein
MAGHSQFANIKHRKGAQDKKKASLFTKLAKEIIVSVKSSGGETNPDYNPRLRGALSAARGANMSNDRIRAAIDKGAGNDLTDDYEEVRYEGYGPGGVAIIVEAMTNNRNRTAGEVRSTFTKNGGNLGETGSVGFMFDRVGMIQYPADKASADAMFEAALEAGADNCESDEHCHSITTSPDSFNEVRDALSAKFGDAETSRLTWKPNVLNPIDKATAETNLKLVELLEENDDVQHVVANFDISDDILKELAAE